MTTRIRRPVLRYHGGKWRLAPWIISHFPPHRVYVEPYGGAASVLMRKPRASTEVYNDLDGEIVNALRVIREYGHRLAELLRHTPYARDEFAQSYEPSEDPVEQARRTIVRSFFGHGSAGTAGHSTGFRAKAHATHPGGAKEWANYWAQIEEFSDRLAGVTIESRPAIDVIAEYDQDGALFYVDPPYMPGTRRRGNQYCRKGEYRHEMTEEDHAELLGALGNVRGSVVISGYPSELYNERLGDWRRITRTAYADRAARRSEVLWLSPNIKPVQGELFG